MNWESITAALPFLLLLACPLSMFWMMHAMRNGESCGSNAKDPNGMVPAVAPVNTDEEVRHLRERLARLEAQHHQTNRRSAR